MSSLEQRAARGLLWGGMSNAAVQLLGALFGIWLARLLDPADYGRMAALVVFSNVASVLQESGFTAALANKREPTHEEYNAVFWFSTLVGVGLYVLLFLASPLIAAAYGDPLLCPLGRYAFLGFVLSSLGTAQRAYLFGHLMVRQNSLAQVAALALSGVVGVVLAAAGMAAWALASQSLVYVGTVTAVAWYFSPWRPTWPRPSLRAALAPAWRLFGFSGKLLVNSLAYQLNNNAFGVLLTAFFGPHVAGIFSNARKWHDMAVSTLGGMVQGVAQPVLRESASEVAGGVAAAFRRLLRFTCGVSFPCLFILALVAEDLIAVLLGSKWAASAQLLSLLCLYGAFAPVLTLYSNLVIARGRPAVNMAVGVTGCALVWGGLTGLHAAGFGLRAMVVYHVVLNTSWLAVWAVWARRLAGLSLRSQVRDAAPFLTAAVAAVVVTRCATGALPPGWLRLGAAGSLAAGGYVLLAAAFAPAAARTCAARLGALLARLLRRCRPR